MTLGQGISSILRNGVFLSGSRFFTFGIRAVYVVLLARHFGAEIFGLLSHSQSWYLLLLNITGLGIMQILGRAVGNDPRNALTTVNQTLGLRLLAVLLTAPMCILIGYIFNEPLVVRQLLLWFALALAGRAIAAWVDSFFTAFEETHKILQITVIFRTLEVFLGLLALAIGVDIMTIAAIHAMSWVLQAAYGLLLASKHQNNLWPNFQPRALNKLFLSGLPLAVATGVGAWIISGPIVLYRYSGATGDELGQFSLLMNLFGMLSTLFLSMSMSALPVLSRSHARDDGNIDRFISTSFRLTILSGTITGLAAFWLGTEFITLIAGDMYLTAAQWIAPMVIILIPYGLANISMQVMTARGQHSKLASLSIIGAVALAIGLPLFTYLFSFAGAVTGVALSNIAWAAALATGTLTDAPKSVKTDSFKALAVGLMTITSFVLTFPITPSFALPTAVITFVVAFILLRPISKEEWGTFRQLMIKQKEI